MYTLLIFIQLNDFATGTEWSIQVVSEMECIYRVALLLLLPYLIFLKVYYIYFDVGFSA